LFQYALRQARAGYEGGLIDLWCYEITHDGEGERGNKVLVMSPYAHRSPEFYAEEAAGYFQDIEKRQEDMDDSAFHGTSMVIEVADYPGRPDLRFRVYCTVSRSYYTTPCPASDPAPAAKEE
jgi:hypothetical protein